MEISGYTIDIESVVNLITQKNYKTIAVQVPEGLKRSIFPLVDFIKKETLSSKIGKGPSLKVTVI